VPRYAIRFARSARKELERLDADLVERVFVRIENLAADPRPPGCRKLRGNSNLWRIRVGDYRVLYEILDPAITIDIIAIRHRREAYD
jgi:mRNA interferase RelE/StbE